MFCSAEARVLYGGGSCTVWLSRRLASVWRRFVSVWRRLMVAGDALPPLTEICQHWVSVSLFSEFPKTICKAGSIVITTYFKTNFENLSSKHYLENLPDYPQRMRLRLQRRLFCFYPIFFNMSRLIITNVDIIGTCLYSTYLVLRFEELKY